MVSEDATVERPKGIWWPTASLVLSLAGCAFIVVAFLRSWPHTCLFCPAFFWALSFTFGIVALVVIRMKRLGYTGIVETAVGMSLSTAGMALLGLLFLVFLGLRGEPYDQSQRTSVKASLENNFGFKFPENTQALKGAHGLGGGVHPKPYVCIVRFTTDPNGLAQLQGSLSKLDDYNEQFPSPAFPDYDPRNYSRTKAPAWYKGKIMEGIVYKASVWRSAGLLLVVAVESEQGDKIDVYMEAVGGDCLKVAQGKTD